MAKRKNTDLQKDGNPKDAGFNFVNRMKAIQREDNLKKKPGPSVPRNKARRVG